MKCQPTGTAAPQDDDPAQDVGQREPAQDQHDETRGRDQQSSAEVRLLGDQRHRQQDDEHHGADVPQCRRQRALVQVPGAHHRHRELHDLRRLEADHAEVEPALGALADVAGERDHHEQHQPEHVGGGREHAQEMVRYLRQHGEECEPDADAERPG